MSYESDGLRAGINQAIDLEERVSSSIAATLEALEQLQGQLLVLGIESSALEDVQKVITYASTATHIEIGLQTLMLSIRETLNTWLGAV